MVHMLEGPKVRYGHVAGIKNTPDARPPSILGNVHDPGLAIRWHQELGFGQLVRYAIWPTWMFNQLSNYVFHHGFTGPQPVAQARTMVTTYFTSGWLNLDVLRFGQLWFEIWASSFQATPQNGGWPFGFPSNPNSVVQ